MKPLFEKHRPQSWDGVIGQERAVESILRLKARGLGGRAYWISGQSGTGKTTIARLIGLEIADEFYIEEVDSTDLSVARLREIEQSMSLYALGAKHGKAYIINEAHGLRKDVIRQLLVMLERLPSHTAVIFTTTKEGQASLFDDHEDSHPLLSRCIVITLTALNLSKKFAARAHQIADSEGLNGMSIKAYEGLARRHHNNFRAMLQAIESGEMTASLPNGMTEKQNQVLKQWKEKAKR